MVNIGEFQSMHRYFTIFVVLVACLGSLFAHGRHIKPLNQRSLLNANPTLASLRATINNVPVPSEDQLKVTEALIAQNYEFADVDSGGSGAGYANAFRPTTPGNSPGVGHEKVKGKDNKDVKVKRVLVLSPQVNVSVAEGSFENDFRPTNPGGVGHVRESKSEHMN